MFIIYGTSPRIYIISADNTAQTMTGLTSIQLSLKINKRLRHIEDEIPK